MSKAVIASSLCAGVLAIAGCGDDTSTDGGTDTSATSTVPTASKPIAEKVEPFNKALAEGDCEAAVEAVFSVLRGGGKNGPPTRQECKYVKTHEESFLNGLADVEFTSSEEYGTAALMEGDAPPGIDGTSTAVWVLDSDGEYHYVQVFNGDAQIGTSLPQGNDADEVAAEIVALARKGKCDERNIDPEGTLAQGDTKAACEAVAEGEYFTPAVKADKGAAAEKIGETLDWAFYGVDTEDGYFTLLLNSIGTGPNGSQSTNYGLSDVLFSSRAAATG